MALARSVIKRTYRNTGPSSEVVEACLERAGYSCEICAEMLGDRRGVDWSLHHRRPRQMGGSRWGGINLPSNLLAICGSAVDGCHGAIESQRSGAVAAGWLVLSRTDSATVAVLIHRSRWVYLTELGGYSDHPPMVAA